MARTTYPAGDALEFDMADRLRRALRVSNTGVQEMAQYLEVDRTTIGNWINGHSRPRGRDLRAFAEKTGFPMAWLVEGRRPEQDSNLQPTDYKAVVSRARRGSSRPPARSDARHPARPARIAH